MKSVERALRDSATHGVLLPGILEYFGSGSVRTNKLKEFDSVSVSLIIHSLGRLSQVGISLFL